MARKTTLHVSQLLEWADMHYERTGKWPIADSTPVNGAASDTWNAVQCALRAGSRGLSGGSSLAQLLAERRGVRNQAALPRLTQEQILAWADAHFSRHGKWPSVLSGPIGEAPEETWDGINRCLRSGARGLAGGSSLARLLDHCRRNHRGAAGEALQS